MVGHIEESMKIATGSHFWAMDGHSPTDIYYDARMPHVAVETGFTKDGLGCYLSRAWNGYVEGFTPATKHFREMPIVDNSKVVRYG